MNEVQFDEPLEYSTHSPGSKARYSTLASLVIKIGLAKDMRGVNKFYIFVTIISLVIAGWSYLHYVVGYNPFAIAKSPSVKDSTLLPHQPGFNKALNK